MEMEKKAKGRTNIASNKIRMHNAVEHPLLGLPTAGEIDEDTTGIFE
jgi:hypothetical protein